MKTFKSEHSELIDWMKEQLETVSELPDESEGNDGSERELAEQEIHREYKEKVAALKMKYNVA